MHLKGRGGRLGLILALISLLLCPTFSILVKASDSKNWFNITYASGSGPFSMPVGNTFTQKSGTWRNINGTGMEEYDGQHDYGQGKYSASSDVMNFTITIKFMHTKNTHYSDAVEMIAGIWDFYGVPPYAHIYFLLALQDGDTDNPMLQFQIGKRESVYVHNAASGTGPISNNVWYTFLLTYCANTHAYYSYLNGAEWSRGNYTYATGYNYWLQEDKSLDVVLGAYYAVISWNDFFHGYVQYWTFTDLFTPPYSASENYITYHCDEGSGSTVFDSSGNNYNGVVDTEKITWTNSMSGFGYALSGSQYDLSQPPYYGVTISTDLPTPSDHFTSSFYMQWPTTPAYSVAYPGVLINRVSSWSLWGKNGGADVNHLYLHSTIGGTDRVLDWSWGGVNTGFAGIIGEWLYFYTSYDGASLRFTVVCKDNGTVFYNSTVACSGTVTKQSTTDKNGYGIGKYYSLTVDYYFDELKLTRNIWSAWQMNSTFYGSTANNSQSTYAYNQTLWIEADMRPNPVTLNPTSSYPNGIGTAQVILNSSGAWNMTLQDTSLLQFIDIYSTNGKFTQANIGISGQFGSSNLHIPLTFIANNKTVAGDVYTSAWAFTLTGYVGQMMTLTFTLQIPEIPLPIDNRSSFYCLWSNLPGDSYPVELYWDTAKTGHDTLYAYDTATGNNILFDITSVGFEYKTTVSSREYNSTFVNYWDGSWTSDHYSCQFSYGIDESVVHYGNFTIWHWFYVFRLGHPEDHMLIHNQIDVHSPIISKEVWGVLSEDTFEDYGNVTVRATLSLYANYKTKLSWTPEGALDQNQWYLPVIKIFGVPPYNTECELNSSVQLSIILPSIVGEQSRRIKVYDFKNPNYYDYVTINVNVKSQGVDFSFVINPKDVYFDLTLAPTAQPHVSGQLYCANSHDFFLSISSKTLPPSGLSVNYPQHLGQTSDSQRTLGVIDIWFIADSNKLTNGDYVIEFDAFYINSTGGKPYVPQEVTVHVKGSHVTITPTPIPTPTPTPVNMTTITPTTVIPVTGMGSGWFRNLLGSVSVGLGWPFDAVAFLVGLVIMLAVVIIIGRTAPNAPNIVHLFGALGAIALDVTIGLWPMWIAILLGVFGAALLSFSVVRGIGGKGGGKPEE